MAKESFELVVPTSRGKLAAVALGGLIFVAAGAWIMLVARDPFSRTMGAIGILFFGLCAGYAIGRLVRPTPALIINRDGIWDNASAVSTGFIAWRDIADLRPYTFQDQIFLGIYPKDVDAVLAKQSAWKRRVIRLNLRLGTPPINIPQNILPMKVDELLREINNRIDRAQDAT